MNNGLVAAGAVLHYLRETEHPNLQHITAIQRIQQRRLLVDGPLYHSQPGTVAQWTAEGGDTLLKVLDNTCTPMGARLLKRWIVFPLKDIKRSTNGWKPPNT
jgi:DNA mismatch repair protein MutS